MSTFTVADEVERVLDYLASTPVYGNTTVTRAVLRALLLKTDGWIMSHGYQWNIVSKHVGAGIYRVTLEQRR